MISAIFTKFPCLAPCSRKVDGNFLWRFSLKILQWYTKNSRIIHVFFLSFLWYESYHLWQKNNKILCKIMKRGRQKSSLQGVQKINIRWCQRLHFISISDIWDIFDIYSKQIMFEADFIRLNFLYLPVAVLRKCLLY